MRISVLIIAAVTCLGAVADVNQEMEDAGPIFTYLLDTGAPSKQPLHSSVISEKDGWSLVSEETLEHDFRGDVAILNDRIAIVLRGEGQGAEVYTLDETGPAERAVLSPLAGTGMKPSGLSSVAIVENHPGAVAVRAEYNVDSGVVLPITFRLTTGQILVQMSPEEPVDAVSVIADTRFLVAPDFFGDDLVYGPQTFKADTVGLPAENFFLQLVGDSDAIVTCVWESGQRNARLEYAGKGQERRIAASVVEYAPEQTLWAAFASGENLWHTETFSSNAPVSDEALQWTPPFDAKWRGNFVLSGEVAASWNFLDERMDDYETTDRRFIVYPCWFQEETPYVRLPDSPAPSDVPLVIYPIDRTQTTPLDIFVLVDVMRGTLGMGPCQYILDIEGLDAQSTPTPALVSEWVEQQFSRRRADKSADKIAARLADMVAHVDHAEDRISFYEQQANDLASYINEHGIRDIEGGEELVRMLGELESTVSNLAAARRNHAFVQEQADAVVALIGDENWEAAFEPISHELHAVGHAQDRTLAKCRMTLRRMYQFSLGMEPRSAEEQESLEAFRERVLQVLETKSSA